MGEKELGGGREEVGEKKVSPRRNGEDLDGKEKKRELKVREKRIEVGEMGM